MISLVVAHDLGRVIGVNNEMPWHIPEELAYFKKTTMGKAIVMGRKTFESIGRPLPGRLNVVITRSRDYEAQGTTVVHDLASAVKLAETYADEVMIIGGAQIFELALALADRLYITVIDENYTGDTFFPAYDEGFKLTTESEKQHSSNGATYTYQVWDKA